SCADRVVAMGGYNTIYEVLSFEKHALIVPRSKPRHEQGIRAERLRQLGLIEVLHPEDVSPAALSDWLKRDLGPPPSVRDRLDLGGTHRLPDLLQEVLQTADRSVCPTLPQREYPNKELRSLTHYPDLEQPHGSEIEHLAR